MPLMVLEMTAS